MKNKIKELQKELKKRGIDCAIFITSSYNHTDTNINYFTGMNAEYCCLAIPASQKPIFIIPKMEYEKAKKTSKIKNIAVLKKGQSLGELLLNKLKRLKTKTIGINEQDITLNEFKALKKELKKRGKTARFKNVRMIIKGIRSTKIREEIKNIRKACKLTDQIFFNVIKNFKGFKTEKDIARFIELKTMQLGLKPSFTPIIASGSNASMPHYTARNIPLKKGFCIIDFGVRYKGYCADMTRTVYIGRPSKKEIETYNHLLECQKKAIALCKQNTKTAEITHAVHKLLGHHNKHFIHGLGHGIGIEIHESPSLKTTSKEVLKEGMVFTVEPGIYVANKFGIRIEDDVLLTKKGPEVLTKSAKNLILIKYPSFNR